MKYFFRFLFPNTLLLSAFISMAVTAEIHQWTDANGNTHFGDKPPQNTESKVLEIKLPPPLPPLTDEEIKRLQDEKENKRLNDEIRQRKIEKNKIRAQKKKDQDLAREKQCAIGRDSLAVLQQETPIYRDDQGSLRAQWAQDTYQGNRQYISDTERSNEIAKADRIISVHCKKPTDEREEKNAYDKWRNKQYCDAARVELEKFQHPSKRASEETIKKKNDKVKEYCGS